MSLRELLQRLFAARRLDTSDFADASEFPQNPPLPLIEPTYALYCLTEYGQTRLLKSVPLCIARNQQALHVQREVGNGFALSFADDPYGVVLERGSDTVGLTIIGGTDGASLTQHALDGQSWPYVKPDDQELDY